MSNWHCTTWWERVFSKLKNKNKERKSDKMTVLHTYAMLNENDICYGFTRLTKKFTKENTPPNMVWIPDENDTYLYTKYDRVVKAFGQEKFEPDTNFELIERLDNLEVENSTLSNQVGNLNENITLLEGTIAELNTVIAVALGGM